MQEMFGKEQFTICQDKINFGLNIPIWKKSQDSLKKLGISSEDGWNGHLEKKLGWLILNFNKEWENLKRQKMFSTNIYKQIQLQQRILKWRNFNLEIVINKLQENFSNK